MFSKRSVLTLAFGLFTAASAAAQDSTRRVYTNRLSFSLPVRIEERDRAELKELKFYVKAMNGGKAGEWTCLETAPPTKAKFSYQAACDGEYWFAFVTVDKAGRVAPADLDKEPPGLVVVVDSHAPEIDVQKMVLASGETYLQCILRDANPDYSKIKLEAMRPDKSVRALDVMNDTPGVFRIGEPTVLRGFVRATAVDKAGNQAVREVDMNPAPPPPLLVTAGTPIVPPAPAIQVAATAPAQTPVSAPAPTSAPVRSVEKPPAAAAAPSAPAGRLLVNSSHCSLDYSVETPHVTRIEAFATRDGGKTWASLGEDTDRRSPIEFDLPGDGTWGVTLVISTISRPGTPPVAGESPDVWIDVDSIKPVVQVSDVRLGAGEEAGKISLAWSAQDKNLAPQSICILYAGQPDGLWQPLCRGRENEGAGKFTLPTDIGDRVYLRVEATDLAGNIGRWEIREPLTMDTGKPKAKVLGISAAGPK